MPARASGGSSTEPTQQNPADSVPPRHEICTAVGSLACIAAIRSAGPTLITVRRSGTADGANSGWSSTGSQIVSNAGNATVARSSTSCRQATSGANAPTCTSVQAAASEPMSRSIPPQWCSGSGVQNLSSGVRRSRSTRFSPSAA